MDTMEMIQNAIFNGVEGATVIPAYNGGLQVNVKHTADVCTVLTCVANVMYEYRCSDVQITTNQDRLEVYIDEIEREEDEEEGEEDDDDNKLRVGMLINWYSLPQTVCYINRSDDTAVISDGYGLIKTVTLDDVKKFNPSIEV